MNKIKAVVNELSNIEGITKIIGEFGGKTIKAVTLEAPCNVRSGIASFFVFKETEVGLAKNLSGEISFSNRFEGELASLEKGKVLARVSIDIGMQTITSIITTEAAERLEICVGDKITAFVKATEVSLEALDE